MSFLKSIFCITIACCISLGIIGGCEPEGCGALFCPKNPDAPPIDFTPPGGSNPFIDFSGSCPSGEKLCDGECIPFEIDCCFNSFSEFVGACTLSEPICCPAGICTTNFDLCPNVAECPEEKSQPCGPECVFADDTCCLDSDVISCPSFFPICCPKGSNFICATNTIEECNLMN